MSFPPQGTNKLNSLGIFVQRDFYDRNVYPEAASVPIDLWYNKPLYGKVDKRNNSVYPSEAFLKQFKVEPESLFALNFVVDAFEDFRTAFEALIFQGCIQREEDGTAIFSVTPVEAWTSANSLYHEYVTSLYTAFSETFIQDGSRNEKILDFASFVRVFIEFIDTLTPLFPFSKTGFITSKYCPPSISGLMVKINKENHSEDQNKFEKFIEDGNFTIYTKLARAFGFNVDKNAPWTLVADLDSPALLPYLEKNEIDLDNLFQSFYYKTSELDIEVLKVYLLQFYNTLVAAAPTVKILKQGRGTMGAVTERKQRNLFTIEQLNEAFPFPFWLRTLAYIRAREIKKSLTQPQFDQVVKQSIELSKFVDQSSAINFINQNFKGQPPIAIRRGRIMPIETPLANRERDFIFS